jgi:DNA-directed RNA polymerase subunit H (RpoH/RPB5)
MSTKSSNRILSLYKSRKTILEYMSYLNYATKDYEEFSINEIDAMYVHNQLDMLLTHNTDSKKVYIKYFTSNKGGSKQFRHQALDVVIEDLYDIENVLTKNDTLICIIDEEPNDTILTKIQYLYERNQLFIVVHNLNRLQFNLLQHVLVPKVEILNEQEMEELKKTQNISSLQLLPEISRFDPQALAIALRPGQVAKFTRTSATALTSLYYRICI